MPRPPHTFSTLEISWMAANSLFFLLTFLLCLPRIRDLLWPRLLWLAFIVGVNMAFDHYDTNVDWLLSHSIIYRPICVCIAFLTIYSWTGLPQLNRRSNAFEQKYQRLLWVIIILAILAIPFILYFSLR